VDDSCGAMRTHAHPHRAPLAARRYAAEAASCDPARREEMPDGCIRTGCPPICAGEPACREEIATMTQLNSLEELTLLSEVLPDDLPADLDTLMREAGLGAGGLYWKLGIRLEEASAQLVTGTMPVAGNTQPQGLLHGGASIAFAETLASTAAAMYAGTRRAAVGVEVSATHHRPARGGTVRGTARAVHLGGSMATYHVELTDERGRLLCSCRVSCMLTPRPGLK